MSRKGVENVTILGESKCAFDGSLPLYEPIAVGNVAAAYSWSRPLGKFGVGTRNLL